MTAHPLLTPPMRSASSTTASSRNTSLNSACPVISTSGRMVTPGLVEREREPRDARVLRDVGVGAREEHAVVGAHRHGAPHLLARDHPAVAVARRAGGETGEVRARARLAEQLAPPDRAVVDRRHEPGDLLLGSVAADGGRGHEHPEAGRRQHRAVTLEGGARRDDRPPRVAEPAPLAREVRRRPSCGADALHHSATVRSGSQLSASHVDTSASSAASSSLGAVTVSVTRPLRTAASRGSCRASPDGSRRRRTRGAP